MNNYSAEVLPVLRSESSEPHVGLPQPGGPAQEDEPLEHLALKASRD